MPLTVSIPGLTPFSNAIPGLTSFFGNFPGEFGTYCSGREPLAKFCDHIGASDTGLAGHPLRSFPDYKNMVVPLRLHGNGVPTAQHRGHTLDILSLHSLVGFSSGSLWDSKGLVLAMVDGQDEGPLPRSKLNGCCLAH